MPKIAYSEAERERVRKELITTGLELMAKQGIQHTTIEQIYLRVGISRTFSIPSSRPRRIWSCRRFITSSRKCWRARGS